MQPTARREARLEILYIKAEWRSSGLRIIDYPVVLVVSDVMNHDDVDDL